MTATAAENTEEVLSDFGSHHEDIVDLYRDLHVHPELSSQEHRTAAIVSGRLRAAGYEVAEGVGGTGVVGMLRNGDGPTVLVRGDMDALPITERTGLAYASTNPGVMHACGHDLHTASLVGAAEALARHRGPWSGTLLVVGQPAEEIGGAAGAEGMVKDPRFRAFPRADVALGQHVGTGPLGVVLHKPGLIMSAATTVDVQIFGRGGHGSTPELCVDPVVTAAHLITRLQTIVSREIAPKDAVVVTTGQVHAGTKANIIPDDATLSLSFRAQSTATRDHILAAVRRIAEAECAASGCPRPPEITVTGDFPLTINDAEADATVAAAHADVFGAEAVVEYGPLMGSEDFSVFGFPEHNDGVAIPTDFWFLGGTPPQVWDEAPGDDMAAKLASLPGNHNSGFAPDDTGGVQIGVKALTSAALAYLS